MNLTVRQSILGVGALIMCKGCIVDPLITDLTFPDATMEACVLSNASAQGWQYASEVTRLLCEHWSISDASGIEHFPNLNHLDLMETNITSIDVSQNLALTRLYLPYIYAIPAIDVSNNTALEILDIRSNELDVIDVDSNLNLTHLHLRANNLTTIDVSNNTALEYLDMRDNPLTADTINYLDSINGVGGLVVDY